jgi:hypothetical protein
MTNPTQDTAADGAKLVSELRKRVTDQADNDSSHEYTNFDTRLMTEAANWIEQHDKTPCPACHERNTRQSTHSEGCWRWHLDCAVAKIERASEEGKRAAQQPVRGE